MLQSNPCDPPSQEDFILVIPRKRTRRQTNFYQPGTGRGSAQARARCTGHPSRGKSDVRDRGRSASAEPPAPSSSSGRPTSPTCDTAISEPAANTSSVFHILANHPDSDLSSDDDEDESERVMPRKSTRNQKKTIFYAPPQQESQRRSRRQTPEPETTNIAPPLINDPHYDTSQDEPHHDTWVAYMDGSFTPRS